MIDSEYQNKIIKWLSDFVCVCLTGNNYILNIDLGTPEVSSPS